MLAQISAGPTKAKTLASVPKLYTTWRASAGNDAELRDFTFGAEIASYRDCRLNTMKVMPSCPVRYRSVPDVLMGRHLATLVLLLAFGIGLKGQETLPITTARDGGNRNGFRLNTLSFSTTYGDVSYAQLAGASVPSASTILGGSASFGWVVSRENTNFSLSYSPSYSANLNYSSLSGVNQALTVSVGRKLAAKWHWNASAAGSITNFNQFQFAPSQLSQIASTTASFDQLATAILSGTSSNIQLNNLLNSVSVVDSPAAPALYGNRFFGASATTGISWAPTSRLTIGWQVGASRTQPLNSPGNNIALGATQRANTLGQSSVNVGYSLSPRTSVTVSASASRSLSGVFPRIYTGTLTATVTRTMSRRWFLNAGAGGGYMKNSVAAGPARQGPQYTYTGGIGYKTYAHTFMVNYNRSLNSSNLALAGGVFNVATAAWTWNRPGSSWSVQASSSFQQQTYSGIPSFNSWNALGGFSRRLTPQLSVQAAYGVGELGNLGYTTSIVNRGGLYNAVRVSLAWSPQLGLM